MLAEPRNSGPKASESLRPRVVLQLGADPFAKGSADPSEAHHRPRSGQGSPFGLSGEKPEKRARSTAQRSTHPVAEGMLASGWAGMR